MAKRTFLLEHDDVLWLCEAVRHTKEESHKTRLRAILQIKNGATKTAVAEAFGVNRLTVLRWIVAYNAGGISGLKHRKSGRPEGNPKWDTTIFDALMQAIRKEGGYWSAPLMQKWIEENHAVVIPVNTIYNHLKHLHFSYKSARPHPYKADVEKQNDFKKMDHPSDNTTRKSFFGWNAPLLCGRNALRFHEQLANRSSSAASLCESLPLY